MVSTGEHFLLLKQLRLRGWHVSHKLIADSDLLFSREFPGLAFKVGQLIPHRITVLLP